MDKKLINIVNDYNDGLLNRRQFITRLSGTTAAASILPLLASRPAMAQFEPPPIYSMKERDRRWANVRAMMSEQGLDCLIIPHASGDGHLQYARYLTGSDFYMAPGAVVFPLKGEPAVMGNQASPWIKNQTKKWFKVGGQIPIGDHIVNKINEMGLAGSNIGVIGTKANVEGLNEFVNEGLVNYATWNTVLQGLPNATFTDVTEQLREVMLVKGPIEIEAYEKTALLGEELHRYMLDMTEIGLDDKRFKANIAEFFALKGASPDVQALFLPPGKIKNGQVINSEYGINYKGGYAQVTLCMAVGKVSKLTEKLAGVASDSLAYGMENLKPGARFGDIVDGMEKIVFDAGCWHGFPQIHSLGPLSLVGIIWNQAPPEFVPSKTLGANVIIKENMIFSLEPGAKQGRGPGAAEVKIGGTALVTRNGARMFNTLGQKLQRV